MGMIPVDQLETPLECQALHFSYGKGRAILTGVSHAMGRGTFTALLGRNGSGKTTLLHCFNGINRVSVGSVFIHGEDIHALGPNAVARQVSLVIQETPDIFPFTVIDVVVMGRAPFLKIAQSPDAEDYVLAKKALADLGIEHLAQANFNRISGGERRMVLLAAALVQSSEIMLLDEPTNHLDFKNQHLILSCIKKLCKERGTTAIAAMHDPNLAMLFADEVVLLKNGQIFDAGPAEKVMTKSNMDVLYDTETTAFPFAGTRQFFIPTEALHEPMEK